MIIGIFSSTWYSRVIDRDVDSKATYERRACPKPWISLHVNDAVMSEIVSRPHLDLLTIALKTDSNKPAVDCVFSSITEALKKKDTVALVGFGTFKVAQRKARKGRNPQTGEEIKIKAKKVPKFVPGKALKDAVS